jgi:hypothetical protein
LSNLFRWKLGRVPGSEYLKSRPKKKEENSVVLITKLPTRCIDKENASPCKASEANIEEGIF